MSVLVNRTTGKLLGLLAILLIAAVFLWPIVFAREAEEAWPESLSLPGLSLPFLPQTKERSGISFVRTDTKGEPSQEGSVFTILLDPAAENLEFKVSVPLANDIYLQDETGMLVENYTAKTFSEIISDQNSTLNSQKPLAAINADYLDEDNHPQGFNVSGGIEYSGIFKDYRSSFAISGGENSKRTASIQVGPRTETNLHFNAVGGNGRFYTDGVFEDICSKLGQYACVQNTNRSMAAITEQGKVIFLVFSEVRTEMLLPEQFDDLLEKIAKDNQLGSIKDAMLFDGGRSPGLMYDGQVYADNGGPIGSVFLIYEN